MVSGAKDLVTGWICEVGPDLQPVHWSDGCPHTQIDFALFRFMAFIEINSCFLLRNAPPPPFILSPCATILRGYIYFRNMFYGALFQT
jgi:hypothetical protein